jgi:hypothetical protein
MRRIPALVLLTGLVATGLAGCVGGYGAAHPNVVNNIDRAADWRGFQYCGGWGCSDPKQVAFSPDEWAEVAALMQPPLDTAAEERDRIAQVIGHMETVIGDKTGYDRDRAGTGAGIFQLGQLDCYSEAANSSTFMRLLAREGLLRFHEPAEPIMRGQATSRSFRKTHATASLTETESGTLYAMDSWFFRSGQPAVWVEAETWGNAWAPQGGAIL